MKENISIFGFKFNTKKFIYTLIAALAIVAVLVALDISGVLSISWYGLIIGAGFILAVVLASQLARERQLYEDFSYDIIWLVFPLAIIGARLFYVLNSPHEFSGVADMLKVWEGGLSIFGGIAGGVVGVAIFSYIKKVNIVSLFDVIAPVLVLGQSIGRWGNFLNQEVYGFEVTNQVFQRFPFAVFIDATSSWHLATFFYESVLNLIGFFVLTTLLRKSDKKGIVVSAYLVFYGAIRLVLESLREEEYILLIPGTSLQASSLFSVVFILAGFVGLVAIMLKDRKNNSKE